MIRKTIDVNQKFREGAQSTSEKTKYWFKTSVAKRNQLIFIYTIMINVTEIYINVLESLASKFEC